MRDDKLFMLIKRV